MNMNDLVDRIKALDALTNEDLIYKYDMVRDANKELPDNGMGTLSGSYEEAIYGEILRRMIEGTH